MESFQGQFLIATPQLRDPNFFRTVVLLVQHDSNGALGLILNRPAEISIEKAWEQVSDKPCNREGFLYIGGPCEGVLMALHTHESASEVEVVPGLHFSAAAPNIEWLVEEGELPLRFFVGYSGWTAGQLESELEEGSWMLAPATADLAFSPDDELWSTIVRQINWSKTAATLNPKLIPPDPSVN